MEAFQERLRIILILLIILLIILSTATTTTTTTMNKNFIKIEGYCINKAQYKEVNNRWHTDSRCCEIAG